MKMAVEGDVRVHGEVSEVSKGEIEEKCELDMSSYQDLPKGGDGDCNEDLHGGHEKDGVVGNGKDDTDGSYVFVSGSDVVADNPVKGVVNADDDPVDGVFNAEDGIVAYPSNNDITLDGSPSISNGDKEGRSDVGEGENGTVVVESKLQQLDSELKVEESHESRLRSSKSSSNQEPDLYQNMVIAELASEIPAEGPPGGYAMLTKPDFEMAACLVAHKQLKTEVRSCHGLDKSGKILPSSHVIDKDIVELAGEIRAEGPPGGYAMLVKPEFEMAIYPVTDKLINTAVSKDSVLDEKRNRIPTCHVKDNDIVEVASDIPVEGPLGGYALSVKSDFEVATPPVTDKLLNTVVPKGSLSGKGGNSLPACHVKDMNVAEFFHGNPKEGPPGGYAMLVRSDFEMAACPVTEKQVKTEVANGPSILANDNSLPACHVEVGVPETEVINDTDCSQNTPELDGASDNAVYRARSEIETTHVSFKSGESLPNGPDLDSAIEPDVGTAVSSHSENGPIDGCMSNSSPNDMHSVPEISFRSGNCVEKISKRSCEDGDIESIVSNGVIDIASSQPIPANVLDIESHLKESVEPNCIVADLKSEPEVENAVKSRDIQSCDVESEFEVLNDSVVENNSLISVPEKDGGRSATGDGDNKQICQESEVPNCIVADLKSESEVENAVNSKDIQSCDVDESEFEVLNDSVVESTSLNFVPEKDGGGSATGDGDTSQICQENEVPNCIVADLKSESEVENAVKSRDIQSFDVDESKFEVLNDSVVENNSLISVPEKDGGRSATGDGDNKQICQESEVPNCIVADLKPESEFENAVNSKDIQSCDVDESEFEVLNDSVVESTSLNFVPEKDGGGSATGDGDTSQICQENEVPNCLVADLKSESEVENAAKSRDIQSFDVDESKFEVLNDSVVESTSVNSVPEKDGDRSATGDGDNNQICQENEVIEEVDDNETATSAEGFGADAVDGQNVGTEAVRRPFYFLIRIPRYDDENLREQIRQAQLLVDEKTRIRDAIRVEIQTNRAIGKKFSDDFDAAILEERTARELLKKKRQEIDPVQCAINRVKSVMSIDEIDGKIRHMEHMIEHETLPLKEEKQLIREVKQLKQQREQISSTMGRQDEVQQAFDQKDKLEELFKSLKKEVDLLRDDVLKAEGVTQAAKKKYSDAYDKLDKLQAKFRAADVIRQDAYKNLQNLRKQLYDKNKYFRMYKEDEKVATDYAFSGDRESLQRLCVNQVEAIMDLWNKNDDFRKEYTRCNVRSTVRRLRTLDGRQLSHGEEPPVLPTFINPRVDRSVYSRPTANSVSLVPSIEEEKQVVPVETEKVEKVVEQKNQTGGKSKKPAKPKSAPLGAATVSGRDEEDKDKEEEFKMKTKEEEELARKAEELRKQEEALELKEQRRLEEKAKALEALERKKRAAEKAQARIELRAQKEAEQKEKERERRAKKKERKKAAANASSSGSNEKDSSPSLGEETRETETSIKDTEMREEKPQPSKGITKRAVNTKQKKAASIPPPLRNRGKRRMQPWMWVLLAVFLVLIFFLVGSGGGFDLGMGRFGF